MSGASVVAPVLLLDMHFPPKGQKLFPKKCPRSALLIGAAKAASSFRRLLTFDVALLRALLLMGGHPVFINQPFHLAE